MEQLDAAIVAEYVKFKVPADQIVADPNISDRFRKAVNLALTPAHRVDLPTLNKRLLNLRRRGEQNGGLPRLTRRYNGRGSNRPR